jgi:hypothetical protein
MATIGTKAERFAGGQCVSAQVISNGPRAYQRRRGGPPRSAPRQVQARLAAASGATSLLCLLRAFAPSWQQFCSGSACSVIGDWQGRIPSWGAQGGGQGQPALPRGASAPCALCVLSWLNLLRLHGHDGAWPSNSAVAGVGDCSRCGGRSHSGSIHAKWRGHTHRGAAAAPTLAASTPSGVATACCTRLHAAAGGIHGLPEFHGEIPQLLSGNP